MIAAVCVVTAASERRRIVVGRRSVTPGTSGSNGVAVMLVPGHRQRAHRAAREAALEGDEPCARRRPRCTSTGARTSGTPRRLPCRCCRRTRARGRTAPRAARRARPAAGGSTGSTCGPARRLSARAATSAGCACPSDVDADARQEVEVRACHRRRTSRTPSPRTNTTGWRLYVCRTCCGLEGLDGRVGVVAVVIVRPSASQIASSKFAYDRRGST